MERSLDDSSYQAVYEKAMERLQRQAPWWTHRELSDPGITLLELWALLADMQSFYLDQLQESHYRKYLKLLGIAPDEGECAWAWIFFGNVVEDCTIPRGTKLLADKMVFELEEETELTANCLTGFYQNDGRNRIEVMNMRRKHEFALQDEGRQPLFTLTFRHAVQKGRELTLFILLNEQDKRNPVEGDFCMARLAWEYRTVKGWREARVIRDETKGLLYSGQIRLRVEGEMDGGILRQEEQIDGEEGYAIRCRIKEGSYDVMPVLYKICLNTGRAIQRDTQCCEEQFTLSGEHPRAGLQSYLARTGELRVLIWRGNEEWEDITEDCEIDPPVIAGQQVRYVYPAPKYLSEKERRCRIVCSVQGMSEQYRPCHITGVTSQQLLLPWQGIVKRETKLMLRQTSQGRRYREYEQREPEATRFDNAWHWQGEEIVLGDGRHGRIPEEAEDGLLLTSLVLSEGEEGNVAIGKIRNWEKPELFAGITLRNMMSGREGKDAKTPSKQFVEAGNLLLRENRLVTKQDIHKLAMETPGLLLKGAEAEWRDGEILVKIIPRESLKHPDCVEKYRQETAKYLEQYRIIASQLKVLVTEGTALGGIGD